MGSPGCKARQWKNPGFWIMGLHWRGDEVMTQESRTEVLGPRGGVGGSRVGVVRHGSSQGASADAALL